MTPAKAIMSLAAAAAITLHVPVSAQDGPISAENAPTYADLVDLTDGTPLVLRAKIKQQAELEPERSPGLKPGHVRLYIEAETLALISGRAPFGELLRYLVDVPVDARGKAPKYRKQEVLLFARPGSRASELQLVSPTAQMAWTPQLEQRLRPILAELVAGDSPPVVMGIRDALAIEGNLAGESETQVFLDTENDGPVSITVVRRPGQAPRWGVSWTEIVDQSARAPARQTLAWYRLACALPTQLPREVNLANDTASRALAAADYAFVIEQLGPCERNRI